MKPEIEAPSAELQDLFAAERSRPGPPPQVADQVLASLQMAIAAAPLVVTPAPVVAKGLTAVLAKTGLVAVVAFLAGGVSGAVLYARLQTTPPAIVLPQPPAPPEHAAAPAPEKVEAPAPAPTKPAREPKAAPPPPPPVAATAPAVDVDATLSAEQNLLDQARTALTRQKPRDAVQALEQHATRFPDGQLVEERESMLIQALVASGEAAAATKRARAFKARFPDSMFLPAVEALVDSVTE